MDGDMAQSCNVGRAGASASFPGKVGQGVHGVAVVTYLEVQHRAVVTSEAYGGDAIADAHHVALLHQHLVVVRVSGEEGSAVLDDDELAVAHDAAAGIHHTARAGGADLG